MGTEVRARANLFLVSVVKKSRPVKRRWENNPVSGSDSGFCIHVPAGKPCKNRPFRFLWKIRSNIARFSKIRDFDPVLNGQNSPLQGGDFHGMVLPIRSPKRPQERGYENRFFRRGWRKFTPSRTAYSPGGTGPYPQGSTRSPFPYGTVPPSARQGCPV